MAALDDLISGADEGRSTFDTLVSLSPMLASNPDAAVPALVAAGISPSDIPMNDPASQAFYANPEAVTAGAPPDVQPALTSGAIPLPVPRPADVGGGIVPIPQPRPANLGEQQQQRGGGSQAGANTKGLSDALSGVKMPAAPATQHITTPHVPNSPVSSGNPLAAALTQFLTGQAAAQPNLLRLRQALEGGR